MASPLRVCEIRPKGVQPQRDMQLNAPINEGGEPLEPGILLTPAGTFGWSALMGIFMANAVGASVAPHWIARFLAPKNSKVAVLQMMWALVALIPIFLCHHHRPGGEGAVAYAGIAVGASVFIAARLGGSANAFAWGATFSLVATLVAVYLTPRPPKEAWGGRRLRCNLGRTRAVAAAERGF